MDDRLRIIHGLTPAQIAERAQATADEVDYWRHIIDDCATVNGACMTATEAILSATASTLMLTALADPSTLPIAESTIDQLRVAIDAVKTIAGALDGQLDMAVGRQRSLEPIGRALHAAARGEEHDEDGDEVDQ